MLHPVNNDTGRRAVYCGPNAISAITGVPISRIEAMIRRCRRGGYRDRNGKKIPIRGTHTWEVVKVLKRLGCRVVKAKAVEGTFARFVDDTATMAGAHLVEVTGHWMASAKGLFADSSNQVPRAIGEYERGKRRVINAWQVFAPAAPVTFADPIKAERPAKPKPDLKVVRARRLAAQIKQWESKKKRAETALKKLRPKLARYVKAGVIEGKEI